MERLSFTCEWITPALWGGANPKAEPEIRSASIKGLLRYWWRVFIQGCRFLSSPELAKREAALFGTTESASPFVVRAYPIGEAKSVSVDLQKGAIREPAYFLFPFRQQERQAWKDGGKFRVEILPRPGAKLSPQDWKEIQASFWLLAHLGGIGTRSRRGFGSFEIQEGSFPEAKVQPKIKAHSPKNYLDELRKALQNLRGNCPNIKNNLQQLPDSPMLHFPYVFLAIWKTPHKSWEKALKEVAQAMQDYCKKLSPLEKRAGFGLPRGKNRRRRASPLWLRVIRLGKNQYTVQALLLKSHISPDYKTESKEYLALVENWLKEPNWYYSNL